MENGFSPGVTLHGRYFHHTQVVYIVTAFFAGYSTVIVLAVLKFTNSECAVIIISIHLATVAVGATGQGSVSLARDGVVNSRCYRCRPRSTPCRVPGQSPWDDSARGDIPLRSPARLLMWKSE